MPEIAKLQEQVHTLYQNSDRHEREMENLRRDVAECNKALLDEIKSLREEIKALGNRLPNWATMLLMALTAIIGGLVSRGGI